MITVEFRNDDNLDYQTDGYIHTKIDSCMCVFFFF